MCVIYGLFIVGLLSITGCKGSILEKMENDPDLSQFCYMLKHNPDANYSLIYRTLTIFAPINAAFQKFKTARIDESQLYLTLYHLVNYAKTTDQLKVNSLSSESDGRPPLWITVRVGTYNDEIYINNARIILNQSNIKGKYNGKEQVLHKIDEVLVPTISQRSQQAGISNPNAFEFLNQFEVFGIGGPMRNFRQRVQQLQREDIFSSLGSHTFFMPIDEGSLRADLIDNKTIDGHVIPGKVLFTAPTRRNVPFATAANGDNLKVSITFFQEPNDRSEKVYIKSETKIGDPKHTPGVVMAQIVTANIPVGNGVVHLIQRPLMVVDTTVKQFLQFKAKNEGPLSKFVEAIADTGELGKEFLRTIERANDITLFAPSNRAWSDGSVRNVLTNKDRMREILYMHLVVEGRLTKDRIIMNNKNQVYQAKTSSRNNNLYFNVAVAGENSTLTVEGGGVNATVMQADIAAVNGIIHIIDRVLGVPYTTVLDKLQQDPMLNETLYLGRFGDFNVQLNNTQKKFTYFVPRDKAWMDSRAELPSPVKKLFMQKYGYYAQQILERHLVESEVPYTMERIKQLTPVPTDTTTVGYKPEVELQSQRSTLKISVEEKSDQTFVIYWRGRKIPVFRPNVECTNGIIHVIDFPFLQEDDLRVIRDSSATLYLAPRLIVLLVIVCLLFH